MERNPEPVNPYREPVHISVIMAELLIELEQDAA
jgi:hypothetical protein